MKEAWSINREPVDKNRICSQPEGGRAMTLLRKMYGKLHLTVNEAKSAVASVFGRKFLGFSFWAAPKGKIKCKVAAKPLATYKQRIRQLTRRSGGRSMAEVVEKLRPYVLGWKAYFRLSQTPKVWRTLDEWMRHRLRAIQLKHWKRGTTMYRELKALGAPEGVVWQWRSLKGLPYADVQKIRHRAAGCRLPKGSDMRESKPSRRMNWW